MVSRRWIEAACRGQLPGAWLDGSASQERLVGWLMIRCPCKAGEKVGWGELPRIGRGPAGRTRASAKLIAAMPSREDQAREANGDGDLEGSFMDERGRKVKKGAKR